jgi:hypothetical protein
MEQKIDVAIWVLIAIFAILVLGLLSSIGAFSSIGAKKTGQAGTPKYEKAESLATIAKTFSVQLSTNFTSTGIYFNITELPTWHKNASLNYYPTASSGTWFNISIGPESNVEVNLCLRANESLIDRNQGPPPVIPIENYFWSNYTNMNSVDYPTFTSRKSMESAVLNLDTYDQAAQHVPIGGAAHFRFWLNVSDAQEPGDYRNRIEFKATERDSSCES